MTGGPPPKEKPKAPAGKPADSSRPTPQPLRPSQPMGDGGEGLSQMLEPEKTGVQIKPIGSGTNRVMIALVAAVVVAGGVLAALLLLR